MAEQKSDLDANEPATPFKLEKAHERGSIARSGELTFAAVLLACVACVYGLGVQKMNGMALLIHRRRPAFRFARPAQWRIGVELCRCAGDPGAEIHCTM